MHALTSTCITLKAECLRWQVLRPPSPYQAGAIGIPIYVGDALGGSLLYQWMGAPKTVKFYPEASKL